MTGDTILHPSPELAALAARAVAGERIILRLADGARVELRALSAETEANPDAGTDPHGLAWIAARRTGRADPACSAVDLVRADRDGGDDAGTP